MGPVSDPSPDRRRSCHRTDPCGRHAKGSAKQQADCEHFAHTGFDPARAYPLPGPIDDQCVTVGLYVEARMLGEVREHARREHLAHRDLVFTVEIVRTRVVINPSCEMVYGGDIAVQLHIDTDPEMIVPAFDSRENRALRIPAVATCVNNANLSKHIGGGVFRCLHEWPESPRCPNGHSHRAENSSSSLRANQALLANAGENPTGYILGDRRLDPLETVVVAGAAVTPRSRSSGIAQ